MHRWARRRRRSRGCGSLRRLPQALPVRSPYPKHPGGLKWDQPHFVRATDLGGDAVARPDGSLPDPWDWSGSGSGPDGELPVALRAGRLGSRLARANTNGTRKTPRRIGKGPEWPVAPDGPVGAPGAPARAVVKRILPGWVTAAGDLDGGLRSSHKEGPKLDSSGLLLSPTLPSYRATLRIASGPFQPARQLGPYRPETLADLIQAGQMSGVIGSPQHRCTGSTPRRRVGQFLVGGGNAALWCGQG